MNIRRPVPLWALLLAILVSGAVAAALVYLPRPPSPPGPDFNLTLSSNPVFAQRNNWNTSIVKVESVRGFVGVVTFGLISSSGLDTRLDQNQLVLGADGNLTLHTVASVAADYTVRIVATGGPASHYVDLVVRVQDLTMIANTTSLTVARGSSGTIGITLKSLNGLSGNIATQGSVCRAYSYGCSSPDTQASLQFAPGNVILQPGGSATIIVTVTVSSSDTLGGEFFFVTSNRNSWWFGSGNIHLTIV